MQSTLKPRMAVVDALKANGWDATRAFEILLEAEPVKPKSPEPPKVHRYVIKKYEEKEAFKRIEEDPINSITLLANIVILKKRRKREEKKQQAFMNKHLIHF